MNILADENVDAPIVERLRASGHQIWYIAEMSPSIDDSQVLNLANQHEAVLLTADKDFGELIFRQKLSAFGVILTRLAGLKPHQKARLIDEVISKHEDEIIGGFSVITPKTIRIRRPSL